VSSRRKKKVREGSILHRLGAVTLTLRVGPCRSALRNDRAANCAKVQARRRIAFTNRRGGFCLLQTSRAFHEGILQHLSAVARMGTLRRLMSTTTSRGQAIAPKTLAIKVTVLNGRSWTLCCVRITAKSSRMNPHVGIFVLKYSNKMGECFPSCDPGSHSTVGD